MAGHPAVRKLSFHRLDLLVQPRDHRDTLLLRVVVSAVVRVLHNKLQEHFADVLLLLVGNGG
jgi:hypothetical protein